MTLSNEKLLTPAQIERETLVNYVLERLDDIKGEINDLFQSIDPPHARRSPEFIPFGGLSALEAITGAIFTAERTWRR